MALFRIFLAGSTNAPLVEVPVDDLAQLGRLASTGRFLEGEIVQNDDGEPCRVLMPVSRICMIAEAA